MKRKMFTIWDSKAEAYMTPFFVDSAGQAVRSFEEACVDEKSVIGRHPADFTLFEIGEWDQLEGKVLNRAAMINLGNGITFVKESPGFKKLQDVKEQLSLDINK